MAPIADSLASSPPSWAGFPEAIGRRGRLREQPAFRPASPPGLPAPAFMPGRAPEVVSRRRISPAAPPGDVSRRRISPGCTTGRHFTAANLSRCTAGRRFTAANLSRCSSAKTFPGGESSSSLRPPGDISRRRISPGGPAADVLRTASPSARSRGRSGPCRSAAGGRSSSSGPPSSPSSGRSSREGGRARRGR